MREPEPLDLKLKEDPDGNVVEEKEFKIPFPKQDPQDKHTTGSKASSSVFNIKTQPSTSSSSSSGIAAAFKAPEKRKTSALDDIITVGIHVVTYF